MKKTAGLLASLVLTLGLLASCSTLFPSGVIVQKDYDLKDFTAVNANAAFQCTISQGAAYAVSVKVDQNVAEYVDVSVSGSTLSVGLLPHFAVASSATMEVKITMPALDAVTLNGASSATVTGFTAKAASLSFDINGASTLNWTGGSTDNLKMVANGASRATMDKLVATNGSVNLNGASTMTGTAGTSSIATLALTEDGASTMTYDIVTSVSGSLNGASTLNYGLSPSISGLSNLGASTIRAR